MTINNNTNLDDPHSLCHYEMRRLRRIAEPEWVMWDKVSRSIHDGDMWWHDNGEQIFPVTVLWSTTGNYFFASSGQWGWSRSQKLSEMRGMWAPCVEPPPDLKYRENWNEID